MEIIICAVCGAFVISLFAIKAIAREFIAGIKQINKDAADERKELSKLIKAESLTDFEMNRPVPMQKIKELTPEEIKALREYNLVGTFDDDDLVGQVRYL